MEALVIVTFLLIIVSWLLFRRRLRLDPINLPPGPTPLPIVGSLFKIGSKPHETFAHLANIYGPIFSLRLGTLTTVVLSSPSAAKEALLKNDSLLCDRIVPDSITALRHSDLSIIFSSASPHWRTLRRICKNHVFSAPRLDSTEGLRRKKLDEMVSYVEKLAKSGEAVDIGQVVFNTTLNLLSNTFFSVDLADQGSAYSLEMDEVVSGMMAEWGKPNLSDYFPVIRRLDVQGIRGRMEKLMEKMFAVFNGIIQRRLADEGDADGDHGDALHALIKICREKTEQLQISHILHLLMDLFVAGTDTTSITVEWAMAELLSNPTKLKKTQQELEHAVGKGVPIKEDHIRNLPYLQRVIKEALRLHPPGPFLVPRKSSECDINLCGFTVPKNSQVLINMWAMGRDPGLWKDPGRFEPERFLGKEIDVTGRDFELIPFGAGRRICPGLPLVSRMIPLMLGNLVNCFEWKLVEGERLDMEDKFGLALRKAHPLRVIPLPVDV